MSRWSPRRARRPQPPLPLPPAASLDLPPDCPDDVRDLARTAGVQAPELLAGLDPDRVGLVLIHPRSPACPDPHACAGRVFATIESRDHLVELARKVRLTAQHRPGWFGCLLVGIETSGFCYLAPTTRVDFERRAS